MPLRRHTGLVALGLFALVSSADSAGAASSKVVTLLDSEPVSNAQGVVALPLISTEKFRTVTLFGRFTGMPTGGGGCCPAASFFCEFLLDAAGDPNTSPGVVAFSGQLGTNAVTYDTQNNSSPSPPFPVLGPRMSCTLSCHDCGNVTMKILLKK